MRIVPAALSSACALALGMVFVGVVPAVQAADKPVATGATKSTEAPVSVEGAWIRATVKGQTATGGFMNLQSSQTLTLVGFSAAEAPVAELHEMKMEGDVMRMRALKALPLPAGQTVSLKPGGHHLMLMGLKAPLATGTTVRLTLQLRTEDGRVLSQAVEVPVKAMAPAGSGQGGGMPHHGQGHGHMHH